ncbi:drug/metabolite transporter (DMT)-like permease [Altererythrobacter atlanticus]|uniref:Riboflavin transporter n=1 Tax=Croceibacterium atlanticum TaxID=1267766 RepID=A0A0F7KR04_9SPHN|nr:DMT family transporter [Croceibacterium atlanticum]AKH42004.1 Riboflavin transporter [Croceibacterium atlanticum]MBB5733428.1 drug/metabolite transporter (DMT)-like permease [Croceibacterium atlanticum]
MSIHNDRAGLLYALAGFGTLSIGDAIIKGMGGMWPPTAMASTRYVLAAIGLSAILAAREGWGAVFHMPRARIQWVRGLSVSIATIAMFTAVWLMPLAEATTITFTQPMITALFAAMILGERLRPAAIGATLFAFVGVVIVLRPNFAELGWVALFPLLVASAMAMLMIANRAAAHSASILAMQVYISVTASVILLAATTIGHFSGVEELRMHWPAWHVFARCAFIAVSASIAHWLIYMGTSKAGAATVAPMTYGQLLVAVVLGWLFFDEAPDAIALLGAAIIVGSGLFLWRINRMKRPAKAAP